MLIKQESITSQKFGSWGFWQITNSVLNKGKSVVPPLFNGLEMLSSAPDKAKLFAKRDLGLKGFQQKKCYFEIFEFKKVDHNISHSKTVITPMFCYFNRL